MKLGKVLITIVTIFIAILIIISYSPELVIRRHLFFVDPIQSITCSINKTNFVDKVYGQQFTIKGFAGNLGNRFYFAYVKKNVLGLYYWTGGGTGP